MSIAISFIFALIDPFVIIPSFVLGWFVKNRSTALVSSFLFSMLIAVVIYLMRLELTDQVERLFPFVIKISVAVLVTYVTHRWKQLRELKKLRNISG
jgi:hypothetical protein